MDLKDWKRLFLKDRLRFEQDDIWLKPVQAHAYIIACAVVWRSRVLSPCIPSNLPGYVKNLGFAETVEAIDYAIVFANNVSFDISKIEEIDSAWSYIREYHNSIRKEGDQAYDMSVPLTTKSWGEQFLLYSHIEKKYVIGVMREDGRIEEPSGKIYDFSYSRYSKWSSLKDS